MGFLISAINGTTPTNPGPTDDFWYEGLGLTAATGHRVNPELAMRVSTVFAATRVRSSVLAMLPLHVYRRLDDGGKARIAHRLEPVLSLLPNRWQTSFQWRQMMQGHVILRGNAYSEILPGRRGFVDQLVPLHPSRVSIENQLADGRLVYTYQPPIGRTRDIIGDKMFHLMGPSTDGIRGLSVIELMRDSVGLALATQEFGGRLFQNAPMMKGIITQKTGKAMDDESADTLAKSFARAHSGTKAHGAAYLPPGLEWQAVGMSNEDAQFLATREFQVSDLLRFLAVPGVLVGHAEKTATYASAEQFFQSFFTYHLDPDFVTWEQAISRDCLAEAERGTIFAEFVRGGLLRGDAKSRAEFYRTMIELGIMTRNEARALENLNALAGLDDPLTPRNMDRNQGRRTSDRSTGDATVPGPAPAASRYPPHIEAIVADVSARLVRREVKCLQEAAVKYAASRPGWEKAVRRFYEKFPDDVARHMALSPGDAAAYCVERRERLLSDDAPVRLLETWEQESGAALASQAIGEVAA